MIKKEEIKHIAELARLELDEKDLLKMQKNLADILDYVDLLKSVDVSKVKENSFWGVENITRKDLPESQTEETIDKIIEQFPEKKQRFAKVKTILN